MMFFGRAVRARYLVPRVLAAVGILFLLQLLWFSSLVDIVRQPPPAFKESGVECPHIPGLEDILVVFRTGASEALEKVPVHFDTVLRCVPHYVLYSDFEEDIAGHHFKDALDEVDEEIRRTNPDFRVYNQLRAQGRAALTPEEMAKWAAVENSASGKKANPNWAVDKWKFLPLVDKALRDREQAKWYVFLEADTYLSWPGLVEWLSHFDASQPHYLGEQMQIGPVVFAYGGSGFILSNPAMRKVSEGRRARLAEYDKYTANNWAGDEILGWALGNEGVSLLWSWPNLQGRLPEELDYTTVSWDKKLWCHYALSYHHMSPDQIRSMFQFEREWARNHTSSPRHSDVLRHYLLPRIRAAPERDDWDSISGQGGKEIEGIEAASFEDCRATCERDQTCMQYTYSSDGRCRTSDMIRLGIGRPRKGEPGPSSPEQAHDEGSEAQVSTVRSGWLVERIEAFASEEGRCNKEDWVLPRR